MNRYVSLVVTFVVATLLVGCSQQIGDYLAASSISENGFVRDERRIRELEGQEVKVWGFVDHANMYGDEGAKQILEEWWSGNGPSASTWRFGLKSREDDKAGQSFAVHVPNGEGRDDLLRVFVADARAQEATQVFVTGKILTFDAPTNATSATGLTMELQSLHDILLEAPEER
jgi:hypothetical protein